MAEQLAHFLAEGGAALLVAFVLSLIVATTLLVTGIVGLVLNAREPRGDAPKRSIGPLVQLIGVVTACLPVVVAIGGALAARAETLEVVPGAAADMRTQLLVMGIAKVINNSAFVAFLLVLLPPLTGAVVAIWGPLRTHAIDLWHARRLEREATGGGEP